MTTSTKSLRVGVIGAGRIGRVHAEHLAFRLPSATLVAVADVNEASAKQLARDCNIDTYSTDYHTILNNADIDAVIICSSTDTHAQIIKEAAEHGKHIFCEKPIDHNPARIDDALTSVAKAGVKFQVGFNRRFDPNFAHVRDTVESGKLGKMHRVHIISRDPGAPPLEYVKVSGGMFMDMTIHDFDMMRFLTGSEVKSVFAVGGAFVDPAIATVGDIDTAVITLVMENGVIGTIDNCREAVYGYDQRVEVFGTKGAIETQNNTPHRATISNAEGIENPLPLNFFMDRYTESYILEMQEFITAIQDDRTPSVTGIDGKAPVLIAMAAKRSLEEGRVIELSEVADAVLTR